MPALVELEEQGHLPDKYNVIATSRGEAGDGAKESLMEHAAADAKAKEAFAARLSCVGGFDPTKGAGPLKDALEGLDGKRLFYAATPPGQFAHIAETLATGGLLQEDSPLVLEKPLGTSLEGYRQINADVARHVPEHLIYRIDHYLGKETVQNLLCLRFANLIFESVWNRSHIDHVQITVAEKIGVAGRAGYYDGSGALRDMVQNHLAQLLCLAAMEPPRLYDADCVRDEKLKVLQSLSPITENDVAFGQYGGGLIDGEKASSYLEDIGKGESGTETFAALRVFIDNWRWAGVPFYLRTGKRLPVRESTIAVRFKSVPHMIFTEGGLPYNQVVIRLQPNEGVELMVNNKIPGPGGMRLEPRVLNLNLTPEGGETLPDAYERLLLDALRRNPTLYMRHDEVEASWRWIEPAIDFGRKGMEKYNAGTWGPDAAQLLVASDGRRWVNPGG